MAIYKHDPGVELMSTEKQPRFIGQSRTWTHDLRISGAAHHSTTQPPWLRLVFSRELANLPAAPKRKSNSVKWKRRALNHRLFDFFGIFKIPEHEMESGLNEILNVNKSLMGVSLLWVFQWFMKSHIWHVYKFNLRPFVVNVITFIITALKCNPWLWCVCLHNLLRVLLRFHKCWSHQSVLLYQTLFWNHSCCSRFPGY